MVMTVSSYRNNSEYADVFEAYDQAVRSLLVVKSSANKALERVYQEAVFDAIMSAFKAGERSTQELVRVGLRQIIFRASCGV